MNRLAAFIRKYIGFDGLLHFAVSTIIAFVLSFFLLWWIASLVTFSLGIAKEIYDKVSKKGTAEWKDLACDLAGSIIGAL